MEPHNNKRGLDSRKNVERALPSAPESMQSTHGESGRRTAQQLHPSLFTGAPPRGSTVPPVPALACGCEATRCLISVAMVWNADSTLCAFFASLHELHAEGVGELLGFVEGDHLLRREVALIAH